MASLPEIKITFHIDIDLACDVCEAVRLVYNGDTEHELLMRGLVHSIEHQANKKLQKTLKEVVKAGLNE